MARGPGYLLSNGVAAGATVESIESSLLPEVQCAFDLARQISTRISVIRSNAGFPIVLSGNCNSAIGTVAGLGPERTGVVWFDAHGEFNTPETTRSGFFDGMPLAVITGRCWRLLAETVPGFTPVLEKNVLLAGGRQTDPEERAALDASGIAQVRDAVGIGPALARIAARIGQWYIHLDLDVLDPNEATSNQWVPPDGWRAIDIATAITQAAKLRPIGAVGLASLDPAYDGDGRALAIARELLATAAAEAGAKQLS